MPGAAAYAVAVSNNATAASGAKNRVFEIVVFIFVVLIAALLVGDTNLGHQPAEVLGVVGQVVEIGGVKIVNAACR